VAQPERLGVLWRVVVSGRYFWPVLLAGCLYLAMDQLDAVLGRMSAIGGEQGSGLGFPWGAGRVEDFLASWQRYETDYGRMATQVAVASPETLHRWLFVLDLLFIAAYAVLLNQLLRAAHDHVVPPGGDRVARARSGLLRWARLGLVALVAVDVVENGLLLWIYGFERVPGWLGWPASVATLLKVALAVAVLAPLLLAGGVALRRRRDVGRALAGARAVLIVVAVLAVLLVVLPLGAQQVDDVVRAWSFWQGAAATLATLLAAWVAVGATRDLTSGRHAENFRPTDGADPQEALLLAAVVVGVVGAALAVFAHAWGLLVPAGMLLLIWAGGLMVPADPAPPTPDGPVRGPAVEVVDVVVRGMPPTRGLTEPAQPVAANDLEPTSAEVAAAGRVVAAALGATVCLVLVWVLARASAFDLLVREGERRWVWLAGLGVVALVSAVCGAVIAAGVPHRPAPEGARLPVSFWLWVAGAVGAVGLLWLTFIDTDATAVGLPLGLGTVAVVMVGVTAAAGGFAVLVVIVRRSGVGRYQLARVFQLVGLKRFPVLALLLVWALAVALIDPGGFHDARRTADGPAGPAPSLEQAYRTWLAAGPDSGARPLVMVAAQGGGIRAAVWTALVMECVFGPTPVRGGEGVCAGNGPAAPGPSTPLPVFAASGASGGSVGLAAWSARRLDLAQPPGSVPGVPDDVDDVLRDDYLAPDIARLLTGDALYLLLAHSAPDRAAMLERTFDRSWGEGTGGLNRGLRASYELATGPDRWLIPVLAMNGSQVEDGCRFVSSPVDLVLPRGSGPVPTGADDHPDDATCGTGVSAADPAVFDALPRTNELIDYLCPGQDVPLSTAAHLSSRFPYISPTARIAMGSCTGAGQMPSGVVSYLTDGGVYDNSGAATAAELWRALQPRVAAEETARSCVVPMFLQIDNEVADASGNTTTRPPVELVAPGQAVLNRFGGLEAAERAEARASFPAVRTAAGREVAAGPAWFRIAPAVQPGSEPPLGWTLATETVDDMRRQLVSEQNAEYIKALRDLLANPPACS
jgi:hypothetical protein